MKSVSPSPVSVPAVEAALAGRTVGRRILHHDTLDSTMEEARRLAEAGEPEGSVVLAERQTAGRGRFRRAWASTPGDDLLMSVLLRPSAAQLPFLNMAASLAVAELADEASPATVSIKWPNDVRIGGRKVAGILVETVVERSEPSHAVVGIGLNVNLDPSRHEAISSTATSLRREAGREMERTQVLISLLERLDILYAQVRGGASLTLKWASRLGTLGQRVEATWRGETIEGVATKVDEQGNLVIQADGGSTVALVAGEVTLAT